MYQCQQILRINQILQYYSPKFCNIIHPNSAILFTQILNIWTIQNTQYSKYKYLIPDLNSGSNDNKMRSRIHNVLSRYQARTMTQLTMSSENLDNLANLASRFVQQRSKIRDNLMSRYKNKLSRQPNQNSNNQSYFRYSTMQKGANKTKHNPHGPSHIAKSRRTSNAANMPEYINKSYTSLEDLEMDKIQESSAPDDYKASKPKRSKLFGVSNNYFKSSSRVVRPQKDDSDEDIFKKYK